MSLNSKWEKDWEERIAKYLPLESLSWAKSKFLQYPFLLKISPKRATKLGDFRPAHLGNPHVITVNGNLNKYSFLVTFAHELAHLINWQEHGRKVDPHGTEWKLHFASLLFDLIEIKAFPDELENSILRAIPRMKASTCADPLLLEALQKYDEPVSDEFNLKQLEEGSIFNIPGQTLIFKKGPLLRKYFLCSEVKSGRSYRVNAMAKVKLIKSTL